MTTTLDYDAALNSRSANAWAHGGGKAKGSGLMRYRMAVRVSLPDDPSYSTCETLEIGARGAIVLIPRRVDDIASLLLINPRTSRQAACRVIAARPQANGRTCVEVEFLAEAPGFWGVSLSSLSSSLESAARAENRERAARPYWRRTVLPALGVAMVLLVALFLMVRTFENHRHPGEDPGVERVLRFLNHPGGSGGASAPPLSSLPATTTP